MAYLGNGIYDLLDVVRASNDPQINYEGLYQDASAPMATSSLLQAMQPGFEYRNPSFMERQFRKGADDLSGNISTDIDRRRDFLNYFNNKPLRSNYESLARFEDFNPRVGIMNVGLPFASTTSEDEEDYLYSGMEDIVYQTPRTIADQNRILGQTFTPRPKSFRDSENLQEYFQNRNPLTGIMNLFSKLPTPMNILRGGLEWIRSLNQKLRGTTFGQSKTFAEYFQKRRDQKAAELAQQRGEIKSIQERLDKDPRGGGGGGFSTQGGGGFSTQGGPYGSGPGGIHG